MMVNPLIDLSFRVLDNIRIRCISGQKSRNMKLICLQIEANRNVGVPPIAPRLGILP
jgi:hypothetical protein